MLDGVRWERDYVHTHTVVMRSKTGAIRYIRVRTKH
jgi:fructose-1,6-bisphosphatase II / sedoheptulose-1,7-bisphosphatase